MSYKEIPLTQGVVAVVDTEDYDYLSQFNWHAHRGRCTFYASRKIRLTKGKWALVLMRHDIIGRPPTGYESDHKDGNGLNNRRLNLRHITHRQNMQNRKKI